MKIRTGTILFAGGEENHKEALDYITKYGLTSDDVSLRKVMDDDRKITEIYIKTKKDIELCEKPKSKKYVCWQPQSVGLLCLGITVGCS